MKPHKIFIAIDVFAILWSIVAQFLPIGMVHKYIAAAIGFGGLYLLLKEIKYL